jgi:hypothetical protein
MNLRSVAALIAIAGAATAAYGLWYRAAHPTRVVRDGDLMVKRGSGATAERVRLRIRTLANGTVTRDEIELPGGTWIDCAGDCAKSAASALDDLWQDQQRRSR